MRGGRWWWQMVVVVAGGYRAVIVVMQCSCGKVEALKSQKSSKFVSNSDHMTYLSSTLIRLNVELNHHTNR
jgi:hypothetical protein